MICGKRAQTEKQSGKTTQGSISQTHIAVFGYGGCGKTSLTKRFLFGTFEAKYKETIEDIYREDVSHNNQTCDLTVLDTAGNYQFPAMRKLAIQKSDGFIIVYSIDNIQSFKEATRIQEIVKEVKDTNDVPIMLVGNKRDEGFRRISQNEANTTMKEWGSKVQHIETSAKTGYNVDVVFRSLLQMIDEKKNEILELNSLRQMNRNVFANVRASFRQTTRRLSTMHTHRNSISVGRVPIDSLVIGLVNDPSREEKYLRKLNHFRYSIYK